MAKKGKTWRPPPQARSGSSRGARPSSAATRASGASGPSATDTSPSESSTAPTTARATESRPPRVAEDSTLPAPNRQARKEEARRQREALRKKAARRRLITRILGIAGAVVVVAGVVLAFLFIGAGSKIPQDLPGI